MFEEIAVAEKVIEGIWEHRQKIAGIMYDFYQRVANGKLALYSFGAGGSGKTTLGHVLSGKLNLGEVPSSYKVSLTTETYKVSGRAFATLYVPPGQKDQAFHIDKLKNELAKAEQYLVILVVCYGYHSLSQIEYKHHKLYKSSHTEAEFLDLYLKARQREEVKMLEDLIPYLKTAPGTLRLITLVTKQDLWWSERHIVRDHYEKGEYSKLLSELKTYRGVHFDHNYVSCALNILNFATRDGTVLKKNTAGYDSSLWIANYNRVIESIRSII
jgi:hypothetical protein